MRVTVTPKSNGNLYGLLVQKELHLRKQNRGTLHRKGGKKQGDEKWVHEKYPGWVRFQKCLGGVLVAQIQAKNQEHERQPLSSFIGFLDRHFRSQVAAIDISYESDP